MQQDPPPTVGALEDAEVGRWLADNLGEESSELHVQRKRTARLAEPAVEWANYALYEVGHDDHRIGVLVEVDEYRHHGPVVVQGETMFCSVHTPFLAPHLPRPLAHREPHRRDRQWALKRLGAAAGQ